jgi:hypothetical protein
MMTTVKYRDSSRFRFTFATYRVNIKAQADAVTQVASVGTLRGRGQTLCPSISCLEENVGLQGSNQSQTVVNELRCAVSIPGAAGLQPGAHQAQRSPSLSRTGLLAELSTAGHPHSRTFSKEERQPLLTQDEQYGGGVA